MDKIEALKDKYCKNLGCHGESALGDVISSIVKESVRITKVECKEKFKLKCHNCPELCKTCMELSEVRQELEELKARQQGGIYKQCGGVRCIHCSEQPKCEGLDKEQIMLIALEAGFMISTQYGQETNQPMPVSDTGTLERFAELLSKASKGM